MAFKDSVVDSVPLTRDNFADPPLEMGIVPFWFWNGDLDYDELEWQLRQYHDRGVRSLFIHGRMGLNVGYLSESWFDRVKFVVEKAREIGIDTWVYDEMDWPSGTAEKQVLEADPDLAQRYLELVPLHLKGPIFTFLEAHDDRYVNTGNSNPIAAYGVRQDEFYSDIKELIDLNKNLSWEKTLPWEAPEGDWVLLYFLEKQAPYYIDTLNPASTEKFLEITHDRYKSAVGDEFGNTVPGFFTDEPAMYYYHVGLDNFVVPWSKQMFKIFRERRGYDLKPHLPALYAGVGADTARIRYDFWRTLTEQYADTYYKRIRDWCDENGVIFTGHLLFEEYLRLAARCEGNMFKYLQHMHLIGVDHLYPKIGSPEEPDQHVALKVGSSAAHHFGSTRLLCESMGGTYWDCSLERMKWMNNWEYVLGVNLFNNHGYHYTIEGERKRDWPPSQFYHHTWWKYYHHFTNYNARLSHLLSGGRHVADVLMLYPINSIWTNYTPQKRTDVGNVIESDFQYLTDALLRLHYDFDYVDEDVLAGATVNGDRLEIGEESFSIVILPPITHIKKATLRKLEEFVANGGSLIADTLLPIGLLETDGADGYEKLNDFFGIDPHEVYDQFHSGYRGGVELLEPTDDRPIYLFSGPGLHTDRDSELLRTVLNACQSPDVEISDEQVFYLHRVKDEFDLYFITNTSQEDRGRVKISFGRVGSPELWNPNDGSIRPVHPFAVRDGRTEIELDFPPSESHFVVLADAQPDALRVQATNLEIAEIDGDRIVGFMNGANDSTIYAEVVNGRLVDRVETPGRTALAPVELPDRFEFRTDQANVLTLEKWKMHFSSFRGMPRLGEAPGGVGPESPGDNAIPKPIPRDVDRFPDPNFDDSDWLEVTNGAWEMQLPTERDEQTYPETLWYRTTFEIVDMPESLSLMIDGFSGSTHDLWINGSPVNGEAKRSWLDAEIKTVDITDHVHAGINVVALRLVVERRTDGVLDLLKIEGDFGLEPGNDGSFRIVEPPISVRVGDWTEQGFPFYSGTGVYTVPIEVPDSYLDGGRVFFEADCGEDVLEVSVNGGSPLVAPWHPYRLDVTDRLRAGANRFEIKVTNTLINILEGVQQQSGLRSRPRLVHEHRYELELQTS